MNKSLSEKIGILEYVLITLIITRAHDLPQNNGALQLARLAYDYAQRPHCRDAEAGQYTLNTLRTAHQILFHEKTPKIKALTRKELNRNPNHENKREPISLEIGIIPDVMPGSGIQRLKSKKALTRKEKDQAMKDLGLKKVRGALGGTYYE